VCHALYLAALLFPLKGWVVARAGTMLAYYACAHTRIAGRKIHHVGPRRLHRRGGAAVRDGGRRPGRTARVGIARTVTPASRSPSPAATSWRPRSRLKRRLPRPPGRRGRGAPLKPRRGVGRRHESAHQLADPCVRSDGARPTRGRSGRRRRRTHKPQPTARARRSRATNLLYEGRSKDDGAREGARPP